MVNDSTGKVFQTLALAGLTGVQIQGANNKTEQLTVDMNYGVPSPCCWA